MQEESPPRYWWNRKTGQHMSEKVKLLGMEDYPEEITQHVRDPKVWKENGRYYMILGAGKGRGMRKGSAGIGGLLWSMFRRTGKSGSFPERSTRRKRLDICGNVPICFVWKGKKYFPSVPRGLSLKRRNFRIFISPDILS